MRATASILVLLITCGILAPAQDKVIPSIAPLKGKTVEGVSKSFGTTMHPVLKTERIHNGVDIAAPVGTEVVSTADGVIADVGENEAEGYFIQVTHARGYATRYTHLSKVTVKNGQSIRQGARIASSGNTGMSSGPHLHYEVLYNGKHLDPQKYLAAK